MEQRQFFRALGKNDTSWYALRWKCSRSAMGEIIWGGCAFLLFLAAGPFCVPVVLLALVQLASQAWQKGAEEPPRA